MSRWPSAADFAHVFDVKGGLNRAPGTNRRRRRRLDALARSISTTSTWRRACAGARAAVADPEAGTLRWHVELPAHGSATINVTVVAADSSGSEDADAGFDPSAEAVPVYRVAGWRQRAPSVVSTDPRLGPAIDRALSDLASLRIVDPGASRPRLDRRRCAVVHDAVRAGFVADGPDDVVVRPRPGQRSARRPRRPPGDELRPSVRRAAGQDRPRAAPAGERRHVQHTAALLRHGRRHRAVRHPRRRGVAMGGARPRATWWRSTQRCNGRSPG